MKLLAFVLIALTAVPAMLLGFVWRHIRTGFQMGCIANDQAWEYVMDEKSDGGG